VAREVITMSRTTSAGVATVRQLCRAFGISRQAFYAARKRPATAAASSPFERRGDWPTAAEVLPLIRRIVEDEPAWGVRKVWAALRRAGTLVSMKRVWGLMHAHGLVLDGPGARDPERPRGHVVVPDSNRRWGTDLTTVWTRRDGLAAVTPVIDCGDRFGLAIGVTKSQEAPAILGPVARALAEEFGLASHVPDGLELRTDHGPQYTGADCDRLCAEWGVDHTLAPVRRPTGNAVSERFILTMKIEVIWSRDWESVAELDAALQRWLRKYNHERPHQALGWRTPAEQRALNLGRVSHAA